MRRVTQIAPGHRTLELIILLAVLLATASAQPVVWFAPLDSSASPEGEGSAQFMDLFNPGSPWPNASAQVQVFKIYPRWIGQATDADLLQMITDLNRRGLDLALEFGPLTASGGCGIGANGYGGESLPAAARRIRSLGGRLKFVAMDQPIYYSTLYRGDYACHWTVDQMAANAARNILALKIEFPDVRIGDIEQVPPPQAGSEWIVQYQRGLDAFAAAFGFPIAFFDAIVPWSSNPSALEMAAFRQSIHDRGIPFGVIYNGNSYDPGDMAWLDNAQRHLEGYELTSGPPDRAIFQSWHPYPKKLLPETDPDSFTSLIGRYFRPRTSLEFTLAGTVAQGSLMLPDSSGIELAPVQVAVAALDGKGLWAKYEHSGTIPPGTTGILFAVRVNIECEGCSGMADTRISGFRFETDSGNEVSHDFIDGYDHWAVSDDSLVSLDSGALHVAASAGQPLIVNSPLFPVTGGSTYKFTVSGQVTPDSADSGYFALIFLKGSEIGRVRLPILTATLPLGFAVTDYTGNWTFDVGAWDPVNLQIKASFAGDDRHWPARATGILPVTQTVMPTRHKEYPIAWRKYNQRPRQPPGEIDGRGDPYTFTP